MSLKIFTQPSHRNAHGTNITRNVQNINARKQDEKVGRGEDKPEKEKRTRVQNQPLNFKIKGE